MYDLYIVLFGGSKITTKICATENNCIVLVVKKKKTSRKICECHAVVILMISFVYKQGVPISPVIHCFWWCFNNVARVILKLMKLRWWKLRVFILQVRDFLGLLRVIPKYTESWDETVIMLELKNLSMRFGQTVKGGLECIDADINPYGLWTVDMWDSNIQRRHGNMSEDCCPSSPYLIFPAMHVPRPVCETRGILKSDSTKTIWQLELLPIDKNIKQYHKHIGNREKQEPRDMVLPLEYQKSFWGLMWRHRNCNFTHKMSTGLFSL